VSKTAAPRRALSRVTVDLGAARAKIKPGGNPLDGRKLGGIRAALLLSSRAMPKPKQPHGPPMTLGNMPAMRAKAVTGRRKESLILTRSIRVDGRKTDVSLEDAFWNTLNEIAKANKCRTAQTTFSYSRPSAGYQFLIRNSAFRPQVLQRS
jgi:hypothetical protein